MLRAVLDETEESGWKNIHGEVFRFPPSKNLFCAFVGSGFQVSVFLHHSTYRHRCLYMQECKSQAYAAGGVHHCMAPGNTILYPRPASPSNLLHCQLHLASLCAALRPWT